MSDTLRPYWPYAFLFFFLNSFLLPHGLLWSALLSPVLVYWSWKNGIRSTWFALAAVLAVVCAYHAWRGAEIKALMLSGVLFFTAAVFAVTVGLWLIKNPQPTVFFNKLLVWNSIFVVLALMVVPFQTGRNLLWYEIPISPGVPAFPRLKLFTYEAAYYAQLFAPLFFYFGWRVLLNMEDRRWLLVVIALALPLTLSLSFGVLACIAIALVVVFFVHFKTLSRYRGVRKAALYATGFGLLVAVALLILWPENPVYARLANIFTGTDTSAKGRLVESFMFAWQLAKTHDPLLGVGLGQIKILAEDLIINYYRYEGEMTDIVRVPNAMAEWLATFGFVGFFAKLVAELVLFKKFRVYENVFNFSLFCFVFVYQFTGSFLVSTAEMLLWCLAFFSRFAAFETKNLRP